MLKAKKEKMEKKEEKRNFAEKRTDRESLPQQNTPR